MDGNVWLVDGVRTPFGRFGGGLRDVPLVELGGFAVSTVLERTSWPIELVAELNVGIAMLEGGMMVPARQMAFAAGLPETLPTLTIDRACCSGMTTVGLAMRAIATGAPSVVALGAESMSRTPRMLHETRWGSRRGDMVVEDILLLRSPLSGTAIANYAGHEALERGVGREDQDAWALQSHQRYFAANEQGVFDGERIPVETPSGTISLDEQPRPDVTMEKLAKLATVYDSPTVTPGNAPGLNDGACSLLVAGDAAVEQVGVQPLARIAGYTQMAGTPTSAVYLPGIAIRELLDKAGLDMDDLGVIEINEAFAATPLVSIRELAAGDLGLERELLTRTNPNGGAVAIGHPTGASGARVILAAAREMRRRGARWGVAAICGGFGQTDAVLIEAP